MNDKSVRDRLHEAIAKTNDYPDEVEGAFLKGWVLVASWVGTDGEPWLTHMNDETSPAWELMGMLQTTADTMRYRSVKSERSDD